MDAAKKQADKHNLQDLVPLNALSDERFAEVSGKIVIEEVKKGRYLFRKGERDNQSIYLLDGSIILIDGHRKVTGEVMAGTDISRYPIANQQPRTLSARAVSKVVIARIDSGLLDVFLTWDQTSSTEATEIQAEDNEDWMTRMLQSEAFIKIPPAMIQRLLIKMQSHPVRKGTQVIRQGDDGDFFYTIHQGSCVVTRTTEDGEEVKLAELSSGDCFGEESLVSDAKRNASVTMTADGLLMRLAKKDFVELLQKPLVRHVGYDEAVGMIDQGAVWLDVRSAGEHENSAFEDSVNIPLADLRGELPELVFNAKYVICCDTGRRSASAAFILSHKGFEVYVLDGGMNSLATETEAGTHPESATGNASANDAEVTGVAVHQEEIEKLRGELAGSNETVSALQARLEELGRDHETVVSERDAGREQLVKLQAAAESATRERQEIQDALESNSQERGRLDAELENERRRMAELQQSLDALQQEKQDAEEQAGSRVAGEQEESGRLQAALDAAESEKQEILAQLEALQTGQAGGREDLARYTEQAELASREITGLKQELERLRAEKRELEISRDDRGEELQNITVARQAAEEALQRQQQESDEQHAALHKEIGGLNDTIADLQMQLEKTSEQATQEQARLEGEFSEGNDKLLDQIEKLELRQGEFRQEREQLQQELQQAQQERDEIRQQLDGDNQQSGELQEEIGRLTDQVSSLATQSEKEINGLREQLEAEQQRVAEARQQLEEGTAGSEELRARLAQQEEIAGQLRGEMEVQAQQLESAQQELRQAMEHARTVEQEGEESLRKAWDDLNRKNDIEKELQGQISRLRKKLEQSTEDLQQAREEAREAATQARDALHIERKERTEERAQMAARQRELKEQLVAIAGEHEALQSNQKGALAQAENAARSDERARLKDVMQTHTQAESQLAALHQELAQAREETGHAVREERERHVADLELVRAQKSELDTVVAEQESRLQALTAERNDAVAEQQSIREQLNILRAEVEIARGLINADGSGTVEDPDRLRAELEEARRNLDIAIRVRSEAEAARDSAIAELNAMQQQQGEAMPDELPLHIPSLDVQKTAEPAAQTPVRAASRKSKADVSAKQGSVAAAPAASRTALKPWLGVAAGFVAVALAAAWFMFGAQITGTGESDTASAEKAAPLPTETVKQAGVSAGKKAAAKPAAPAAVVKSRSQAEPAVAARAGAKTEPARQAVAAAGAGHETQTKPVEARAAEPEIKPVTAGRNFSDTLKDGSRGPELVELPAATYMMGSSGASPNFEERPQHAVSLPAFAIGRHEVTFAEYDRFARATGRRLPYDEGWGRNKRPVINVSWKDAKAYTAWLSKQTGHKYSLPTEAQWEFAARAGSTTPHWWPDDSEEIPANCFDCGSKWGGRQTAAVGSFSPNGFGLHDTAGNVQEWTRDCYHKNYKGAPSDGSAWQTSGCGQRVIRGGGYTSPLDSLRSARRAQFDQETRLDNLGFRVVRTR